MVGFCCLSYLGSRNVCGVAVASSRSFGIKVLQVSCGEDHSAFVCCDGFQNYIYASGSNQHGKLGINVDPDCV